MRYDRTSPSLLLVAALAAAVAQTAAVVVQEQPPPQFAHWIASQAPRDPPAEGPLPVRAAQVWDGDDGLLETDDSPPETDDGLPEADDGLPGTDDSLPVEGGDEEQPPLVEVGTANTAEYQPLPGLDMESEEGQAAPSPCTRAESGALKSFRKLWKTTTGFVSVGVTIEPSRQAAACAGMRPVTGACYQQMGFDAANAACIAKSQNDKAACYMWCQDRSSEACSQCHSGIQAQLTNCNYDAMQIRPKCQSCLQEVEGTSGAGCAASCGHDVFANGLVTASAECRICHQAIETNMNTCMSA